jgi:hypothetical protein
LLPNKRTLLVDAYNAQAAHCRALRRHRHPRHVRFSNGEPLVTDAILNGFARWRRQNIISWRIEDELPALGPNLVQAGLWKVSRPDANLVTGGRARGGGETVDLIVETLGQ